MAVSEQGAWRVQPLPEPAPTGAGQAAVRAPLSVIIVNFNGGPLLSECARAVLASTLPVRVIVSDNGSSDGSIEWLRTACGADDRLEIVTHGVNHGFARGNNLVLDRAAGEYLLFLNTDCLVQPDTLARLLEVMEQNPQAGMCGCLIRNTDGSEQAGCRRSVPTPWRASVHVLHLHKLFPGNPHFESFVLTEKPLPSQPAPVEAISGAMMFVRRAALEQVGPLDEGYFMHCEDLDWCMRFRERGWQVLFVPDISVTHHKGECSKGRPVRVLWHKHRGMVRFYRKFFSRRYPRPLMWLVGIAVWLRFTLLAAALLLRRSPDQEGRVRPPAGAGPAADPHVVAVTGAPSVRVERVTRSDPFAQPVLVTGATGFIGSHLVQALLARGAPVHAMARNAARIAALWPEDRVRALAADLARPDTLPPICAGVKTVFHLASYAHVEPDRNGVNEPLYRQVIVQGTEALLDAAVRAGVRRVVFFSTVKAMGEGGPDCLDESCRLLPESAYGRAKLEAERLVLEAGRKHGLHVCNLRFPLVYGAGHLKGNLPRMIAAIGRGLFPPVPEVGNRRSMVHVDDVVQAALLAAENPRANGQTYIVTDGETYSLRQLYLAICAALGRPVPAWTMPLGLLRAAARVGDSIEILSRRRFVINSEVLHKLTGSAWYSSSKISRELGFRPVRRLAGALPEMVAADRP